MIKLNEQEYKLLCEKIFKRDKYKCRCCGSRNNLQAHHIVYRSKERLDIEENLISICPTHHDLIHRKLLALEFPDGEINANNEVKFIPCQPQKT